MQKAVKRYVALGRSHVDHRLGKQCLPPCGGRHGTHLAVYLLAVTPSFLPIVSLKDLTHSAEQRAAHFGTTVSAVIFFSIWRSASVGSTRIILPLTGCVQAAAPVLQS